MKHTPGPWVTDNGGDAFYGVFGPNGGALAYLLDCAPGVQWQSAILPMDAGMTMRERFSIHEANATLMAAAPAMLEALKEAQRELLILDREMRGIAPEAISHALPLIRAAIEKAEPPQADGEVKP